MGGGEKATQAVQISGYSPKEYSRVPEIFSGGEVPAREWQRGFFSKAADREDAGAANAQASLSGFDVTVACLGLRGRYAENHQVAGRMRQIQRGTNELAITRGIADVAVRRQDGHQRVAVLVPQMYCRKRNGGGGVAADRLGKNGRGREGANVGGPGRR